MAKKVTIDNMDAVISEVLEEYAKDVKNNLHKAAVDAGKIGTKALQEKSKSVFETHSKRKPYWRGWKMSDESTRMTTSVVLHNATVPGLPHLLENGHAKRGGGRVPGTAHIAPVEKKLIEQFERIIKAKV